MQRTLGIVAILVSGATGAPRVAGGRAPQTTEQVKAAVRRALPLIQKSAAEYVRQKQCFSCHHQALPILAMVTAREHGFQVDEKELEAQLKFTAGALARGRDSYRKGEGQGGQATAAGYALWTLESGGWKGDETTAAVVEYLLSWQTGSDHYRPQTRRPPAEASKFTVTYVALRGMSVFGVAEQKERVAARLERVRLWVLNTPAQDTEDRVFRLWALKLAGAGAEDVEAAKQELLATQCEDGGWAQTDELESDAYATGTALFVLYKAGGLAVEEAAYQRGVALLVRTQQPDGSWWVHTRTRPQQTFFESGFPHGKDQFISILATSWATAALAAGCPDMPDSEVRARE